MGDVALPCFTTCIFLFRPWLLIIISHDFAYLFCEKWLDNVEVKIKNS